MNLKGGFNGVSPQKKKRCKKVSNISQRIGSISLNIAFYIIEQFQLGTKHEMICDRENIYFSFPNEHRTFSAFQTERRRKICEI